MISLKEIVKKYSPFMSDFDMIKQYFIENRIENKAVEMLTQLSTEQIRNIHFRASYLKEIFIYTNAIFSNDIPENIKLKLHNLCISFIYEDLSEEQLKEAKEIFNNYTINCCWCIFYNYLVSKGCIKGANELTEFQLNELNNVIKIIRGDYYE